MPGLLGVTLTTKSIAYEGEGGPQGNTGSQGIQGNTGSQGIQGNTGTIGNTGSQGIQGNTGTIGNTGSQGIQGNTGSQGVQGNTGTTGNTGSQGIQGNTGTTGNTGSQGIQGNTGAQGNTGSQGIQGNTGGPTTVVKTSSQTHAAVAGISFCNGLSFSILSGVTYSFEFRVLFGCSGTTTGLRLGLSYGAVNYGAAFTSIPIAAPGTAASLDGAITVSGGSVTGTGVQALNTTYLAMMDGIINPSSNTTLNLMMGSNVVGQTTAVKAGSTGRLFTVS